MQLDAVSVWTPRHATSAAAAGASALALALALCHTGRLAGCSELAGKQ
jgi:hypothetical protein